ncbi:MAG: hypothetical protein ACYS0D_12250, partial [Planctomycetota bacterium]
MTDRAGRGWIAMAALALVVLGGCHAAPRNEAAIRAYYAYDFTTAREELRPETQRNDEQILLNTLRLGLAALADGDPVEAERALTHAFELLSTAGLNRDRTTAAVFVHEGVRIWKGEPFEQALAYTWIASLYATLGDWENVRAAAANALFRLTDFGSDQDPETLARNAARDPQYLERGYTAVDTDFALGFLLQAIGSDLSGAAGARGQFEAALQIDPNLGPLVDVLRERRYDTLLIVDYGKGPTKIAYGPDNALAAFAPQERTHGPMIVRLDGREVARTAPVCNVSTMAVDHRWNNLEDVRRAKSAIGNLLVTGGAVAMHAGSHNDSGGAVLVGLGMLMAGLLTKSGAHADTRYLEFAPHVSYLVPVLLYQPAQLELEIVGEPGTTLVLDDVEPGRPGQPRAIYLRLHGPDSPQPPWLDAEGSLYTSDPDLDAPEYPWILGGRDVSPPTRDTLAAYHAAGYLDDMTVRDLEDFYSAEAIRNDTGRHILEGGEHLWHPQRDS